jgi:hypothetical protein
VEQQQEKQQQQHQQHHQHDVVGFSNTRKLTSSAGNIILDMTLLDS